MDSKKSEFEPYQSVGEAVPTKQVRYHSNEYSHMRFLVLSVVNIQIMGFWDDLQKQAIDSPKYYTLSYQETKFQYPLPWEPEVLHLSSYFMEKTFSYILSVILIFQHTAR